MDLPFLCLIMFVLFHLFNCLQLLSQLSTFLFVKMQLYHPWLLVIERQDKYFRLQIGSKQDVVSVDRLKPVFSDTPVTHAVPPPRGRPRLYPVANSSVPPPSSATWFSKKVTFKLFPRFFHHLYLLYGILTGLQEIEGSAPPYLRRSFCWDYSGGYESCLWTRESLAAARRKRGVSRPRKYKHVIDKIRHFSNLVYLK